MVQGCHSRGSRSSQGRTDNIQYRLDSTKPEEAGFLFFFLILLFFFFFPVHFKCVLNSRGKKYYCFLVLTSVLPERSNHWNAVYHCIGEGAVG